ncbi:MAG: F0F1 ATP synthase subunit A [Firmicutes bacterium]|nr:F0F1 ATP synthase subunit A [Bacillota bacterium]
MTKKQKLRSGIVFVSLIIVFLVGSILTADPHKGHSDIQETMRDAVLHETGQVRIWGDFTVNPGLVSAFTVTGILFIAALIIRIFVIPRFTIVPGKLQLLLEQAVGLFDGLAEGNSPHRNRFLSVYIFTAGVYIFSSTLFELLGVQVVTTNGASISLPAPLSDINGAICLGCLSYLIIMSGGIAESGIKGVGKTLKEFSLPISMSFRLFGALISGALVTELVYHYSALSYGLPVIVGVLFTLLHAVIQAYVLTMLTSLFYGEVSEPARHLES